MRLPSAPGGRKGEAEEGVVLYGAGSPLLVDVEESCAAAGLRVLAIVRNVAGPVRALRPELATAAEDVDPALLRRPLLAPMFRPAHRRAAVREVAARLGGEAPRGAVLVDPHARVPPSAILGPGVYVNAGVVLGGAVRIGAWALINRSASIGHHGVVGEFASIGPGVTCAGSVEIGEDALIGAGAVIAPEVRIGARTVIAPGAVVRRDVPDDAVAAGGAPLKLRTRR